jgi:hypothetical protein
MSRSRCVACGFGSSFAAMIEGALDHASQERQVQLRVHLHREGCYSLQSTRSKDSVDSVDSVSGLHRSPEMRNSRKRNGKMGMLETGKNCSYTIILRHNALEVIVTGLVSDRTRRPNATHSANILFAPNGREIAISRNNVR